MNEYVLINKSTDLTDAKELDLLLEASLVTMGEYASAHATTPICATWAATDDEFKAKVAAGARPVVFQNADPSEPDAAGYHTLAGDVPTIVVPTDPTLKNGGGVLDGGSINDSLAGVLTHEFGETEYNPYLAKWVAFNGRKLLAGEPGDPLQGVAHYATCKDGTKVLTCDLCTPDYFDPWAAPGSRRFSLEGAPDHAGQLLPGGYQVWLTVSKAKQGEIFGALAPHHDPLDVQKCATIPAWKWAHKNRPGSRLDRLRKMMLWGH